MNFNVGKIIKHISNKRYIKKNEHIYGDKLKYLYIDKKSKTQDTLMIVFSAFTGDVPRYNYFSSFKNMEIGQLYILDNFGYKGSYYWMEDGSDEPESITLSLIRHIVEKYGYKNIITVGTSKGGNSCDLFWFRNQCDSYFFRCLSVLRGLIFKSRLSYANIKKDDRR